MIPKQVQERPNISRRHICTNCGMVLQDSEIAVWGKITPKWKHCPICGEEIEWDKVVPVYWNPLDCNHCGKPLVWRNNGIAFASEDYVGGCLCMDCRIEHCLHTNCLACEIGSYPGCRFENLKQAALRNRKDGKHE